MAIRISFLIEIAIIFLTIKGIYEVIYTLACIELKLVISRENK